MAVDEIFWLTSFSELVHNHPSGYPASSKSDVVITSKIVKCGKLLGKDMLDPIIFSESSFVSLKQPCKM